MVGRLISSAIGAVRDIWRFGQVPPSGRIATHAPNLDSFRNYVSDQLNPSKLRTLLRAVDSGDLATTLALFEEMEGKDASLRHVINTRRSAVTRLDWRVADTAESLKNEEDKRRASEAADYCQEELEHLECFIDALEHLQTATGPNVAVAELVWDRHRLIDILPVASHRLRTDNDDPRLVRVLTEEDQSIGVPAISPKFVVHIPHPRAAFPFSNTMCHAQAMLFLIKLICLADWGTFCEIYGMPARWAEYPRDTPPDVIAKMVEDLKNMSSSAAAAFPEGTKLNLVESTQRGQAPYQGLIEYCDRQMAKMWVTGNLPADTTGGTGTHAAADVQDEIRRDVVEDDARREGRTVRSQILAPMVAYRFGNSLSSFSDRDIVPLFLREFKEEIDQRRELENILMAQRADIRVSRDYAHERTGIPKPDGSEETLDAWTDDNLALPAEGVDAGA